MHLREKENSEDNELLIQEKEKADKIIQLVKDERKKQGVLSNYMHLFFHPQSPYSQLSNSAKHEVVEKLECLLEKNSKQETQSDVIRTASIKM